MKILFSLSYYYPYISGLSVYAKRLAEGLSSEGLTVEILTSRHDYSLAKEEKIGGILITRVPYLLKINKGLIMPAWIWRGYQKVKTTDCVICHLPQPESLWLLFLAKVFKKKVYVIYHCDVVLPSSPCNRVIGKALMIIGFLSCALAQKIINSSEDYAKHSPVLRHFLNRVVVIYPPVGDLFPEKVRQSGSKVIRGKLAERKYKIGYVGRIAADKGVEYLLQGIPYLEKRLSSFGIFLVGHKEAAGEEKYLRQINSLIQKYSEKVFILGQLTDEDLAFFFQNLDVLVLPSVNSTEAFGMVQMEAMVSGCPVVVSDLPGVRVPVKLTKMGEVVSPGDPLEISKAIIKIIKNKSHYVKNRSQAEEIFFPERTINQYQSLL